MLNAIGQGVLYRPLKEDVMPTPTALGLVWLSLEVDLVGSNVLGLQIPVTIGLRSPQTTRKSPSEAHLTMRISRGIMREALCGRCGSKAGRLKDRWALEIPDS